MKSYSRLKKQNLGTQGKRIIDIKPDTTRNIRFQKEKSNTIARESKAKEQCILNRKTVMNKNFIAFITKIY